MGKCSWKKSVKCLWKISIELHELFCEISWNSMEFHETEVDEISRNSMKWNSMELWIHGISWNLGSTGNKRTETW
jgi:hypothetical protein